MFFLHKRDRAIAQAIELVLTLGGTEESHLYYVIEEVL